ncbi:energy-coupling factor ABC transporter ATP-binding protein, partial [Myxococcota bacterium]|nr:energy-coupling factor ABC transporter ATP-binding protein [Myxococcota bacterium]
MTTPLLSIVNLSVPKKGRAEPLLDKVTLFVEKGERVALVGLNGSGKTTLLGSIAGLFRHEGEIRVEGELLTSKSAATIRGKLGYLFNVPEDQLLFPRVLDDVAYGLIRGKVPLARAHEKALEVLKTLGIEQLAHCTVHNLSHGQKQRVALAGALITGAPLLLLDEPSAALDPVAKMQLAKVLRGITHAGILCATNDLEFARAFCHRYIFIEA